MKKSAFQILVLATLVCAGFTACQNPIIETWWQEGRDTEFEYVPLLKMVPQITYRTIIDEKIDTVFIQLPPEIITEYIFQTLPPEIIFTIVEQEVIHEVIVEVEVIREIIKEVVVENTVYLSPTPEQIIEFIRENPEIIIQEIRENVILREEIISVIMEYLTEEQIKEIIQKIPPEQIINYLTKEQIEYIVNTQPPHMILQSIRIINIEYILFSGNGEEYNGPPGEGAYTNLTDQERNTNDRNLMAIARGLADNPDYLVILHGHANPVFFTEEEIEELKRISEIRANAVKAALEQKFLEISGGVPIDSERRLSAVGYGGGNNISVTEGSYAGLNRRVEVILFEIQTMTRTG